MTTSLPSPTVSSNSTAKQEMRSSAARELLSRRKSRRSLVEFTKRTMPAYTVGAMHDLIGARLEDCARGATRRLIIEAPRRHGKSELASKRFPAWYIGSRPDKQIICCSYAADLASDFGRDVRNIVSSDAYTSVFPAAQLQPTRRPQDDGTRERAAYTLQQASEAQSQAEALTCCSSTTRSRTGKRPSQKRYATMFGIGFVRLPTRR